VPNHLLQSLYSPIHVGKMRNLSNSTVRNKKMPAFSTWHRLPTKFTRRSHVRPSNSWPPNAATDSDPTTLQHVPVISVSTIPLAHNGGLCSLPRADILATMLRRNMHNGLLPRWRKIFHGLTRHNCFHIVPVTLSAWSLRPRLRKYADFSWISAGLDGQACLRDC
jgi:hypothetical protein